MQNNKPSEKNTRASKKAKAKPRHGGHNAGKRHPTAGGQGPVAELLEKLNWSQQRLADAIGCHRGTVRRLQDNGTMPQNAAVRRNLEKLLKDNGIGT